MVQLKVYSNRFHVFAFFQLSVVSCCYLLAVCDVGQYTTLQLSLGWKWATATFKWLPALWSSAEKKPLLRSNLKIGIAETSSLGGKSAVEADSSHWSKNLLQLPTLQREMPLPYFLRHNQCTSTDFFSRFTKITSKEETIHFKKAGFYLSKKEAALRFQLQATFPHFFSSHLKHGLLSYT